MELDNDSSSIYPSLRELSTKNNLNNDHSVYKVVKGEIKYYAPGELIQPCNSVETLLAVAGAYKIQNTVQIIWLKSKQFIEEDVVLKALHILCRQIPHLQFCLSRQGMQIWFRRIKDLKIDFKSCTNKDGVEIFQEMLETSYDMWNGPLWKVRLVYIPAKENSEDEKPTSYTSALVFSVQHTITDGTTNMILCRDTVALLNKMFKGENVSPIPIDIPPYVYDFIDINPSLSLIGKTFIKKFVAVMLKSFNRKSSFEGNLQIPKIKNAQTKVIYTDFTETETRNMLQLCKGANITVHSFITTLTNLALMTLAQSKTKESIGSRSISSVHCINLRRHYDSKYANAPGCHMTWVETKSKMCLSDAKDFWAIAKKVHSNLKEEIEVKKSHLTCLPLLRLVSMVFPTNRYLTKKGYKNKTDCHYVTTNMGNLKHLLPEPKEGDDVEITYMLRGVSSHLSCNPFLLTFHTFRNKFMLSLDYYTNKMTDENAEELFTILCQFVRKMTTYEQLSNLQQNS